MTWRVIGKAVGRLLDICMMIEHGVVVLFLPRPFAAHEAARGVLRVVGSFLEWRCRWSLEWLLTPLTPLPLRPLPHHHCNPTTSPKHSGTHHEPQPATLPRLPSRPPTTTRRRLCSAHKHHRDRRTARATLTQKKTLHALAYETEPHYWQVDNP